MAWFPATIFLHLDEAALVALSGLILSLLVVLLVPPVVSLWCIRRAEAGADYLDQTEWSDLADRCSWIVWIALERYFDLQGLALEAIPSLHPFVALVLIGVLPGLLPIFASWLIWYPISQRKSLYPARGLTEFLLNLVERSAMPLYLPFFLSTGSYPPLRERWLNAYTYLFFFAVLLMVGVAWRVNRRAVKTPPLAEGELYRRVLHLADRAGTRLKAFHVIDDPHAPPLAGAAWGHKVSISAAYLRALPPEQVDGLLAHEVAHLRHRDHLRLALFGLIVTVGLDPALVWALQPFLPLASLVVVESAVVLLGFAWFMRRAEYRADALASDLVGPESVIRCLCAIHRMAQVGLTQHPILEAASTHPTLLHRLRAVARRHACSIDWLRSIVLEAYGPPNGNQDLRALASINLPTPARVPSLG